LSSRFSTLSYNRGTLTMHPHRPDPTASEESSLEALWGFAAAFPPAVLLCGAVLLALAALG